MNRRAFLRATPGLALLSGCLAKSDSRPSSPTVSLQDVTTVEKHPIDFSMRVTQPHAAEDHPPILEYVNRNPTNTRLQVYYGYPKNGGCPLFESHGDDPNVVLAAKQLYQRADVPDECWRLPRGPWARNLLPQHSYYLEPGETKVVSVGVLGKWSNEDSVCIPSGTYHLESDLQIDFPENQRRAMISVRWGLTLQITHSQ